MSILPTTYPTERNKMKQEQQSVESEFLKLKNRIEMIQSAIQRKQGQKEMTEKQLMELLGVESLSQVDKSLRKLKSAADKATLIFSQVDKQLRVYEKELNG